MLADLGLVAALIVPPAIGFADVAVALGAGLVLVAAARPGRAAVLGRARGLLLIGLFAAFIAGLSLR